MIEFRSKAFTSDGRIEPALIREVIDYASRHFAFQNEAQKNRILEGDQLIYLIVEELLRGMEVPSRRYLYWSGDISVVSQRCWYLDYDEETRRDIINAFFDALPGVPKGDDRKTFQRLVYLFPNEFTGRMEELVARELATADTVIANALAHAAFIHDYRHVPEAVFVQEPYKTRYRSQIMTHFRAMAARLGRVDPNKLFGNAVDLGNDLKIPSRLALVPEFKAILDDERLKVVTTMTDQDFLNCFVSDGRRMSIGHAKFHAEAQVSGFMRRYINRRYKRLVP
ncbi:hypothetical protein HYW94_00860 [Candidatus Uhrbacteria bacterium]|nr:hypothetical protein [Candidatus Uhrbacteria bacterium]